MKYRVAVMNANGNEVDTHKYLSEVKDDSGKVYDYSNAVYCDCEDGSFQIDCFIAYSLCNLELPEDHYLTVVKIDEECNCDDCRYDDYEYGLV